jgi:hypothetical protein
MAEPLAGPAVVRRAKNKFLQNAGTLFCNPTRTKIPSFGLSLAFTETTDGVSPHATATGSAPSRVLAAIGPLGLEAVSERWNRD